MQRHTVITLDLVRVLAYVLWDGSGELLILLTERIIGRLHIYIRLQLGTLEQLDQVEVCSLLDGGQFAQGHQLVTWHNCRGRHNCKLLILVQDNWMAGSNTQPASHTGINLHHCAFIRPPGDGFYIGKDGLPILQVKSEYTLIRWLHKLYYISLKWSATFSKQGIEATRHHIRAIERENCLIGLKTTPPVSQPRVQKRAPDTFIEAHTLGHFLHISPQALANLCYLIDKGYLRCQKRIGRVLNHLRCIHVSNHNTRAQRQVERGNLTGGVLIRRTKHHAVGVLEIAYSRHLA